MDNELIIKTEKTFEDIKHIDESGNEYWYARELMVALGYSHWDNFYNAISKAILSCNTSKASVDAHFREVSKMVKAGVASKPVKDYILTRYACYLIAQNGDETKKEIALAQAYFAVQTRKQEVFEETYKKLSENQKRLFNRNLSKAKNLDLADAAQKAGVTNYGRFHNAGYKGMYGKTASEIKKHKGLSNKASLLDNMGSEELGANIFRITQTEARLKNDSVKDETSACNTHYQVGETVRNAIISIGGTLPEDLPVPEKSIKQIEKEQKKILLSAESKQNDIEDTQMNLFK